MSAGLDDAAVFEDGTHEELLHKRGRYHAMYGEEGRMERVSA